MLSRIQLMPPAIMLILMAASIPLHASGGSRVQFGRSIAIAETEDVGSVVCIGCSIRVDGTSGDAVAIGGSIIVTGTVKGDVAAVGGGTVLEDNAMVEGDVATVGGQLLRHSGAVVKGEVNTVTGAPVLFGLVVVPLIPVVLIVALIIWLVKPKRRQSPVRT